MVHLTLGFGVNTLTVAVLAREHGVQAYALYALIGTLLSLLPFADLGMGAGIVNITSDFRSGRVSQAVFQATLRKTRAILLCVCGLLVLINTAMLVAGSWRDALGGEILAGAESIAPAAALYAIAITLPFSVGARVLQGLGLMRVVSLAGVGQAVVQGVGIVTCWAADAPPFVFAVVPSLSYAANTLFGFVAAQRAIGRSIPSMRQCVSVGALQESQPVASTAVPFLIMLLTQTLVFQSPRLVLAHVSSVTAVAAFSIVWQYYAPLYSIVTVLSQGLWPRYRDQLGSGSDVKRVLHRDIAAFAALGALGAIALACIVVAVNITLLRDAALLDWKTLLSACALMMVMSTHQPSAMLLHTPAGLRFQAVLQTLMAICAMAALIPLATRLGATAPFVASAVSALLFMLVPCYLGARRHIERQATGHVPIPS